MNNEITISVPSIELVQTAPSQKRSWRKIEPKDERIILKGMKEFRPLYLIARDLGVSRGNLYTYVREKMNLDYKDVKESMLDIAEAKLMQNIADGNQNAIQFFLDRQGKSRGYGEKQQMDRQDVPTINIGTIQINKTDEKKEIVEVKQ